MRSGKLDKPIVIQAATITYDSFGGPIETWERIHPDPTIPAQVVPKRGDERWDAMQVVGKAVQTFKIRYRTGVHTLCRILYDGSEWDIHDVREVGRREGLEIDASARSEDAAA